MPLLFCKLWQAPFRIQVAKVNRTQQKLRHGNKDWKKEKTEQDLRQCQSYIYPRVVSCLLSQCCGGKARYQSTAYSASASLADRPKIEEVENRYWPNERQRIACLILSAFWLCMLRRAGARRCPLVAAFAPLYPTSSRFVLLACEAFFIRWATHSGAVNKRQPPLLSVGSGSERIGSRRTIIVTCISVWWRSAINGCITASPRHHKATHEAPILWKNFISERSQERSFTSVLYYTL